MKNIKLIGITIVIIFVASSVALNNIQAKKIKARDAEIARIELNNIQLMAENSTQTTLILKEKELTGKILAERDSIAERLKIRPKQIEKIITIDNSTHDTIKIPVPATNTGVDKWKIMDSGQCFKWAANAFKQDNDLKIERTLFEYNNKTTQTFYRERPHKFLFIRFGKWQYKQQTDSECGGIKIKEIQFIK